MSQSNHRRPVRLPTSLSANTGFYDLDIPATSRQRQSKKDEAIRKKIEQELSKKKPTEGRVRHAASNNSMRRVAAGTVSALRPAQALTVRESMPVTEAAQLMAAKRSDCVLVVGEDDGLSGLFTAKDLAYRVVAGQMDTRTTLVADIMTRSPLCVSSGTSAQEALNLMVSRGFRHLPVCNEDGDIYGLLDITRCLYEALHKMERAYGSSRKLYDALEGVEREWHRSPVPLHRYIEALREKMSCPTIATVLEGHAMPVQVPLKANVREAVKLMKESHTTAVLVMDQGGLAGIFTTKDIVLRVMAAGLAPDTCSVVRVMTPHPDTVSPNTSIMDALKKMHDGRYLNLPVMDETRMTILGLVDVLRLTYATLEQINSIEGGHVSDGQHKFWDTITSSEETFVSGVSSVADLSTVRSPLPSVAPAMDRYSDDLLTRRDSTSILEDDRTTVLSSTRHSDNHYTFKFHQDDHIHRFRCPCYFDQLETLVRERLWRCGNPEDISVVIAYLDDEKDQIVMTCDADVADAVQLAQRQGHSLVRLFVHIPGQRRRFWPGPLSARSTDMLLPAAMSFLSLVLLGMVTLTTPRRSRLF